MAKQITIVGLGAGDLDQLPFGVYKLITTTEHLFLRTKEHPIIEELKNEITYTAFDFIYEENNDFDEVYHKITAALLEKAAEDNIVYAVPGHPLVAEKTVQLLLTEGRQKGYTIVVQGGQSFLDSTFQALEIDPIEGFQLVDALTLKSEHLQLQSHIIITQVYDQMVASDVKLTLMEQLPDDYKVMIVTAAGSSDQQLKEVPLYKLDRETSVNNLTSVYVPPVTNEELLHHKFTSLREIIAELRGPNGCPWDKEQTHHSLKRYLIEECYELIEAIEEEDIDHMIEELGDVLLQVVLHAQIGEDEGMFTIDDVIKDISDKMVRRHPHVFGETVVKDTGEVLSNWDEIKRKEKAETNKDSILDSVATSLPALSKAFHLQKKAAKVGFDWPTIEEIWEKVKEEIREFEDELGPHPDNRLLMKEFGDVLFALVNVGRHYNIEPEEALISTNKKFYDRFYYIEKKAAETNRELQDMSLEEMDNYWDEAKKIEKEG
ncbi:nucleoside triphosphate pyrophosphohydrolase [Metabacillus sediminilitoris]|uniref:Nucleoside triphosphate pyrophosphohydrolase n=1 Tax=Metabacillus sediminilitoris TaxID=2567941 RepID=A0A4S4BP76_9BACI|nr:nucleoside triphosphate pyrophosphohydrolase [Metabacillus sediminilitoris]QGQ43937.1 nucleoside triphosphate pyrophosphohydrolase [Metabacillus sediminilitoris]THF75810.1 nucleoside triphosphate pyrophosphohydrolase [Metabacillus sediminilitoris]